jgi:hypothetical protein
MVKHCIKADRAAKAWLQRKVGKAFFPERKMQRTFIFFGLAMA